MAVTRAFVESLPEGREKEHYKYILNDYMRNDEWSMNIFKPIGVLLTAHPGSRPFLKASIESHKKLGYWLTVAYDNYFEPKTNSKYDAIMPERDVLDMIDTFIMPHHQTWGGVMFPYFWLLKFGIETMGGFDYIYCSNGDCVIEKPENFPKIIEMLGDADIMGCGWEETPQKRELFNTTAFIAKTDAARAIIRHFQNHFVGIDNYEKYTEQMGNTESRFAIAIKDLGLKVVKVEKNPFNTQLHKPSGTFYDILGFRHIHGEFNFALKKRGIPPEPKYLDSRYMRNKYELVKKYYETKDEKFLKQLWGTWNKPR